MSDPVFFLRATQLSLRELVALTGARAAQGADLSLHVYGGAPFDEAEPGDLAYFAHPKRVELLTGTYATACFVTERFACRIPSRTIALVTDSPEGAFANVLARMYPSALRPGSLFAATGVNPGASIHPEARLEPGVIIDPGVVIGPRAEIGADTIIAANSVIGPGVRIGRACSIGAQSTLANALIGDRVILHPGARIGQPQSTGRPARRGRFRGGAADRPRHHSGRRRDRGQFDDRSGQRTRHRARRGAKIGNLVQICADVTVGRKCQIMSQSSIGAGTQIGDFTRVEGQAGAAEDLRIGPRARILAQSGVVSDAPAGAQLAGAPARPLRQWLRAIALNERLTRPKPGRGASD